MERRPASPPPRFYLHSTSNGIWRPIERRRREVTVGRSWVVQVLYALDSMIIVNGYRSDLRETLFNPDFDLGVF